MAKYSQKLIDKKSLDELYDDADEAVKEAQTLIKRIKRLFFGA